MSKLHHVNLRGGLFAAMILALVGSADFARGQAIYNSIPNPLPGDAYLSLGLQAAGANEVGDGLIFTMGSSRQLTTVSVVLSSFACTSGVWSNVDTGPNPCVTSPQNATFPQAVTLNIYSVNPGPPPEPGTKIATITTTFNIKYRPSSDYNHCDPVGPFATPFIYADGESWFDESSQLCYHGLAQIITFDLTSMAITLPGEAIVTVTWNTSDYGYTPIGHGAACYSTIQGCPYDALNVGTDGDPTLGQNVDVNGIYVFWTNPASSCNGTTSGALLLDTPCWTDIHVQMQVDTTGNIAGAPPSVVKYFGAPTVPLNGPMGLNFIITNPSSNVIALTGVGFTDTLPSQLQVANPSNLSSTCGGTATATPGTRLITLSGVTLAAMSSCDLSVNVAGVTPGAATNSVQVTSTNGGNGNISSATIAVVAPPKIVKTFGADILNLGGTTSLTFAISNPIPPAPSLATHAPVQREPKQPQPSPSLEEIEFADYLTAGLVVANPNSLNNTCGGMVTANPGSNGIALFANTSESPITLASGAVCTVTVNVSLDSNPNKLSTIFDYVNVLSVNGGDGGPASAALTVSGTSETVLAVSVSPNKGTGLSQTFDVLYYDSNGASDINVGYFEVTNGAGSSPNSCYVAYVQSTNSLYLFSDSNGSILGPVAPGSNSTVTNSQCTLSGSGGVVAASGTNLTVPFNLTFKPGFTGSRNLFAYAQSYSGVNGGFEFLGDWTPAPAFLAALSVSPNGSSGAGPLTFSLVTSDDSLHGGQFEQVVYMDFGTTLFAPNSCIVAYIQLSNQMYLFNDANTAVFGPVFAGNPASTASNSQCTLTGAGGLASVVGNNFTAPFNITFLAGFGTNPVNIWGLAQDYFGYQSGWQILGQWTP